MRGDRGPRRLSAKAGSAVRGGGDRRDGWRTCPLLTRSPSAVNLAAPTSPGEMGTERWDRPSSKVYGAMAAGAAGALTGRAAHIGELSSASRSAGKASTATSRSVSARGDAGGARKELNARAPRPRPCRPSSRSATCSRPSATSSSAGWREPRHRRPYRLLRHELSRSRRRHRCRSLGPEPHPQLPHPRRQRRRVGRRPRRRAATLGAMPVSRHPVAPTRLAIRDPGVDAVVSATPHSHHHAGARRARGRQERTVREAMATPREPRDLRVAADRELGAVGHRPVQRACAGREGVPRRGPDGRYSNCRW